MMIAAHPEISIQVDGHYVGIVLAVSEHPHLLPERSTNVRIVEAGAQMSRRPAPKPVPDDTDRPEVNKPGVAALRKVVMVAMITEAVKEVIQPAPEIGQERSGRPIHQLADNLRPQGG